LDDNVLQLEFAVDAGGRVFVSKLNFCPQSCKKKAEQSEKSQADLDG
jgi:hypothetical protein